MAIGWLPDAFTLTSGNKVELEPRSVQLGSSLESQTKHLIAAPAGYYFILYFLFFYWKLGKQSCQAVFFFYLNLIKSKKSHQVIEP